MSCKLIFRQDNMRKFTLSFLTFFILFYHYSIVQAENPLTPEKLEGVKIITAIEVKSLNKNFKIFDVRNELEYSESHIPGSINLHYKEKSEKAVNFDPGIDKFDLSKLPKEKNAPIIFYCNGERCWKSYKSSVAAIKDGYNNIHWFRKGIPDWISKGFPIEK